jgi:predicted nuclease of restriction endonuclease-like (RecB) superfamily
MSSKKMSTSQNKKKTLVETTNIDKIFEKAVNYIHEARVNVGRTIDTEMVKAYWFIGRDIIEEEQLGNTRSAYGSQIINELSKKLSEKYGRGFGVSTLKDIRKFYSTYQYDTSIGHAVRGQSQPLNFSLSWVHYRALMRIHSKEARQFYEIEAAKNCWSGRELERQIDSLLFERLLKSKDKIGLMRLAKKGQEIFTPEDAIKDPVILEFLSLPESHRLVESKLESALIHNLQEFLLELGTGFAFIARQKRLTIDGDNFYADLVFYHVILKCYIIVDIKTKKLSHADLGQMMLYVNYFDREVVHKEDNPTIGLILCTRKSDEMVKYTLGDNAKRIFASKYQFHLPTEEQLEKELKREIKVLKHDLEKEK